MPMDLDVERLDQGDGMEATMRNHNASWHKTCHLKFNEIQLDRVARRKEEQDIVEAMEVETMQDEGVKFGVWTCSSIEIHDYKKEVCSSVMSQVILQDFTVLVLMTSTEMLESVQ